MNGKNAGVVSGENKQPAVLNDIDTDAPLVVGPAVFAHQQRWVDGDLSQADLDLIGEVPIRSAGEALQRFQPEPDFELSSDDRERLLKQLSDAGISLADLEDAFGEWRVHGPITQLEQFAPSRIQEGSEWEHNVVAELRGVARAYQRMAKELGNVRLERQREDLLAAIDTVMEQIELLDA